MARILVRHNNKFKLWCTTIDQWVSPLLNELDMVAYLMGEGDPVKHTFKEAFKRVRRIGYPKRQLKFLNDFYDNCYERLSRLSRRNGK